MLKGRAKNTREGQGESQHFQIKVSNHEKFRIAINNLPFGFQKLESIAGGNALDLIRSNMFDTANEPDQY